MVSNISIEEEGISLLQSRLRKTRLLRPNIISNDKTPIWDGEVFLLKNESDKKDDIIGRVPIQVKSHQDCPQKKHRLEVTDLENFLLDGGAIFFAVYLNEDFTLNKICFHKFLPVDLERLLKKKLKKDGQVKMMLSFDLFEFPEDNNRILEIFKDFLLNRKKQTSFIKMKKPTLSEIDSGKYGHYEVNFTVPIKNPNEIYEFQKYNEISLYLKNPESGISIPIQDSIKVVSQFQKDKLNIGVGGKVYFDDVIHCINQNGNMKIKFGSGFSVDFIDQKFTFNFSQPPMLADAILANEFLLEVIKYQFIEINGAKAPLNKSELKIFDFSSFKNQLNFLKKIKKMLNLLDVEKDLDLSKVTEKEENLLNNLVGSLLESKTIKSNGEHKIHIAPIGNLNLALYLMPINKSESRLLNLFKDYPCMKVKDNNGDEYNTSVFEILPTEAWEALDNINIETVVETFERLKLAQREEVGACQVFVKVFNAYKLVDESDRNRKVKLLNLAKNLVSWDLKNATVSEAIVKVNYYLTKKEENSLDDQDYTELNNLMKKYKEDSKIIFAINVLMGAKILAQLSLEKVPRKELEEIKEFPIYKVYEEL